MNPKEFAEIPRVFTFVLIDLLVEEIKLTPGKARKAVLHGKVSVDDTIALDPNMRVGGDSRVVYRP